MIIIKTEDSTGNFLEKYVMMRQSLAKSLSCAMRSKWSAFDWSVWLAVGWLKLAGRLVLGGLLVGWLVV